MGGDKFSVVWCQPVGFIQVVEKERECGSQSNFSERCSVVEEILRGTVAINRRTST
jgi:hypothetical protein